MARDHRQLTKRRGARAIILAVAHRLLAQLRTALGGSLDDVVGCVRLGGFVNAAPEFGDHPKVINGASDLMVEVFGDAGRHARAAVGCSSLPRNVAVEVELITTIAMEKTIRFAIREGGKTVGAGRVSEIAD